jgi:hypothetical protein
MKRTYHYTPSWLIGFLFIGVFIFTISVGTLVVMFPSAMAGNLSISDLGTLSTILLCLALLAAVFILTAIMNKIVVSPSGLEYHTVVTVVKSSWQDVILAEKRNWGVVGSSIMVTSLDPKVTTKEWVRRVLWDLGDVGIAKRGIPVSWFGGFNGKKLKSDLEYYAPHLFEEINGKIRFVDKRFKSHYQVGIEMVSNPTGNDILSLSEDVFKEKALGAMLKIFSDDEPDAFKQPFNDSVEEKIIVNVAGFDI